MRNLVAIIVGSIVMLFILIGTFVIAVESIKINRKYNVKDVLDRTVNDVKIVSIYK